MPRFFCFENWFPSEENTARQEKKPPLGVAAKIREERDNEDGQPSSGLTLATSPDIENDQIAISIFKSGIVVYASLGGGRWVTVAVAPAS